MDEEHVVGFQLADLLTRLPASATFLLTMRAFRLK